MKFGVSNSSIEGREVNKNLFETTKKQGFELLELSLNNFPLSFREAKIEKIKNLAKENNLKLGIHAAMNLMEFCHENRLLRETSINLLKSNLIQSQMVGAKYFIFHLGKAGTLEGQIETLQEFMDFSRNYKPKVLIENSYYGFGVSDRELEKVLEALKIDMNLDIGHLWIAMNKRLASIEMINKFSDRIKYVHIHSNFGSSDDHLPLGEGNLPFKEFFERLIETKAEYFTLECHCELEELAETKKIIENLIPP